MTPSTEPSADLLNEAFWLTAQLGREDMDFPGAYMLAGRVRDFLLESPAATDAGLLRATVRVLSSDRHEHQTQAIQYYGVLARALASAAAGRTPGPAADAALSELVALAVRGGGARHRAAAEALGELPVRLPRVTPPPLSEDRPPSVTWPELVRRTGAEDFPMWLGRSLVAPLAAGSGFLVVKLAREAGSLPELAMEAEWMNRLGTQPAFFSVPCRLPRPIRVRGGFPFRLARMPTRGGTPPRNLRGRPQGIAFTAPPQYFSYPNDPCPRRRLADDRFFRVLVRSARLLGELVGSGIVHTAPIPLFHNRIQRGRRADAGLYHWWRGGRLDRWLHSSRHPNFGLSGLRDLEHLEPAPAATGGVYRAIGGQLLSLILVAGSHFRHKAAERMGIDDQGRPVDVRDLFDRPFFVRLIQGAVDAFYRGFAGPRAPAPVLPNVSALAAPLVEAMGVDRHMGEILRSADQHRMDDEAFAAFLSACGRSAEQIRATPRGAADIHLCTGPHLGGFNDRISVPELIDFLAASSAACVTGRFLAQRRRRADVAKALPGANFR